MTGHCDVLIDAGFWRKAVQVLTTVRGEKVPAAQVALNAAAAREALADLAPEGRTLRHVYFYEAALSYKFARHVADHFVALDADLRERGGSGLPAELLGRIRWPGTGYQRTMQEAKDQRGYFKALDHAGVTVREGVLRFKAWELNGSLKNAIRALAQSEAFQALDTAMQFETLLALHDAKSPRREQNAWTR